MKRKVYHPARGTEFTGRADIWQWNIEACDKSLDEGIREVYKDEVYRILKRFNILNGLVLDAGCGYGRWVKALYDEGISVYGVDFAGVGIHNLSKLLPYVPLFIGDVRALPFKGEVFDVILSLGVMEHSEGGPMQALKESFRCLNSHGTLVVSVPFLSLNRLLNPLVVLRRFASSINLFRYLFGRGERQFFQYEFSMNEFMLYLRRAGFKTWIWCPTSVDFGVKDDFRGFSGLFYPIIKRLSRYPLVEAKRKSRFIGIDKFIRYFLGAFVLFIAKK